MVPSRKPLLKVAFISLAVLLSSGNLLSHAKRRLGVSLESSASRGHRRTSMTGRVSHVLDNVYSFFQQQYDRARDLMDGVFGSIQGGRVVGFYNEDNDDGGIVDEQTDHANTTHWCVISPGKMPVNAKYFWHFPHCMEMVLPCWSWFRSQRATNDCGFVLVGGLRFDSIGNNTWQNQLVRQHMGCKVWHARNEQAIEAEGIDGVFHSPNFKFLRPKFGQRGYLKHPDDAQALRRVVGVSDEWVETKKGAGKPLQIGVIQRKVKRTLTNIDALLQGLQQALPEANVTMTTLDYPSVQDQAKWFASKHVIVAAHGAALTNSVFVTKGTFVLQLYPPGFYWSFYDHLIEQSGGVALDWYRGDHPVIEFLTITTKNSHRKNLIQHQDFSVPVEEVVDTVLVALDRKEATPLMMKQSTFW